MNKKKVLIIILIVTIILILAFAIYFIRNIIIINRLDKINNLNNYSYTATIDNGVYNYSYKDGKSIEILRIDNKVEQITWRDNNSKETILMYPNELKAEFTDTNNSENKPMGQNMIDSALSDNTGGKIFKALTTIITTKKIDGTKYYMLKPWVGIVSNTYYFNKDNKFIEKVIIGNSEIDFKDWKINGVTDEIVNKPDLTLYQIVDKE